MTIRQALPTDAATLGKLLSQLGYPASEEDCIARIQIYREPYYHLWVGVLDQQVIGFIALHEYHAIHHTQPIGRVIALCVDEEYRGKGLGGQLLQQAEKYFQEQGCLKVELTSNVKRTAAHDYYLAKGYQQMSKHFVKKL